MLSGIRRAAAFAPLLLSLPACIDAAGAKKDPNAAAGGTASAHGGTSGKGGTGAGAKGGTSGAGGNAGASGGGVSGRGGGGVVGGDAGVPVGSAPVLDSATAQVTGRNGDDVTLTVAGSDPDKDVSMLDVTLTDAADAPVIAFDTNWDGVPDSSEQRLVFDRSVLGEEAPTGTLTLVGFSASYPGILHATVALVDQVGNVSGSRVADVGAQEERAESEPCDPAVVLDRCPLGMACTGDPATCVPGTPPAITDVAYVRGALGPLLLVTGTDPDDDVAVLHLEFLSRTGAIVLVDLNGDQIPESSSFDLTVAGASRGGAFFVKDPLGLAFEDTVPRMKVTPIDGQANSGSTKTVDVVDPPFLKDGDVCDARGYDVCLSSVCSPGLVSAPENRCVATPTAQKDACAAAPTLDPVAGPTIAYGRAEGGSRWDPPAGCAQQAAVSRPEGVVRLHLPADVNHLTVTTALPETTFDTVVYLVDGACGAAPTATSPCNDDVDGFSSTITADSVAAGDYLIVVDSARELAGGFAVAVSVE